MFSGEVAVICPVGMSQARRQILAKGLVANHATVLDFSPGDVIGPSPASSLLPKATDIFVDAPKGSSKRKRASSGAGDGASSGKRKAPDGHGQATEYGSVALAPTMVVCDAASFSSARAIEEMEGIFNKYPLKEEASSVKVVASAWLSECLRLGSAQPMGSHLLDTITPATAKKFSKKSPVAAVSGALELVLVLVLVLRQSLRRLLLLPGGASLALLRPKRRRQGTMAEGAQARPLAAAAPMVPVREDPTARASYPRNRFGGTAGVTGGVVVRAAG
ncbi:unnamed protein product, partial [Ectocarpus sp. 12 AP-2014]